MFGSIIAAAHKMSPEEGEAHLEAALARDRDKARRDDVANLLMHLATYASNARRYDTALARIDEAIALLEARDAVPNPLLRHCKSERANVLERAGRIDEAIAARVALDLPDARSETAWMRLSTLQSKRGDSKQAAAALEAARARASKPDTDPCTSVDSIVRIAENLAVAGRREDAIALIDDALSKVADIESGKSWTPSARGYGAVRAQYEELRAKLTNEVPK